MLCGLLSAISHILVVCLHEDKECLLQFIFLACCIVSLEVIVAAYVTFLALCTLQCCEVCLSHKILYIYWKLGGCVIVFVLFFTGLSYTAWRANIPFEYSLWICGIFNANLAGWCIQFYIIWSQTFELEFHWRKK